MTYKLPSIPDINETSFLNALQTIKEILEVWQGLRGPDPLNDRVMTLSLLANKTIECLKVRPQEGITGYFDDGANFRVTLVKGIVTNIEASSGAGYSIITT